MVVKVKVHTHEILLQLLQNHQVSSHWLGYLRMTRVVKIYHHLINMLKIFQRQSPQSHPLCSININLNNNSLSLQPFPLDFLLQTSKTILPINLDHLAQAKRSKNSLPLGSLTIPNSLTITSISIINHTYKKNKNDSK